MSVAEETFGPDFKIKVPSNAKGVAIWARVSATDATGVTINGIKKGCIIRIEAIGGLCSFSDKSFVQTLTSVAGIVGGFLTGGFPLLSGIGAKQAGTALKSAASSLRPYSGGQGKIRTGYGKVKGESRFATKEGGIIVCMPSARGPIYAADDTYLHDNAEAKGRLSKYVKPNLQDWCFFPCRRSGGLMEKTALVDGPAYILVFDKDYEDNAGAYEVKFTITRPGGQTKAIQKELLGLFNDAGL